MIVRIPGDFNEYVRFSKSGKDFSDPCGRVFVQLGCIGWASGQERSL
jgi:hypothetical protein